MIVQKNISLKPYNTFGLSVHTPLYAEVTTSLELQEILNDKRFKDALILGGGSNVLFLGDLARPVIKIAIKGIRIIEENDDIAIVSAGAGVLWHDLVMWCVANNLGGIENLSLIPGLVGAAPIQNIGAYGVELADVFQHVIGISRTDDGASKIFTVDDCAFGYRDSVFKNELKDQFVLTTLRISLTKKNHMLQLDYGALAEQLDQNKVSDPNLEDVARAVTQIRRSKLPDPEKLGNAGSFFKNPVIGMEKVQELLSTYPNMPSYPIDNHFSKIPAGWLIEQAGFKGQVHGNVGMHDKQALVLVNHGEASGKELWAHAQRVMEQVYTSFGVELDPEVNIIS